MIAASARRTARRARWALAGMLALTGCPDQSPAPSEQMHEPRAPDQAPDQAPALSLDPALDPSVEPGLRALGDRGALVLIVREPQLAELRAGLELVAPGLPGVERWREPGGILGVVLGMQELTRFTEVELPSSFALRGRDPARPMILSLLEVEGSDDGLATIVRLAAMQPGHDGLGHQVWIPAIDPAAVIQSVLDALGSTGEPWPELVAGLPGAEARSLMLRKRTAVILALVPGPEHVRLVCVSHVLGLDRERDLERWRARIQAHDAAPEPSLALRFATRDDHAIAALLRNRRVPAAIAALAMFSAQAAVDDAPEHRRHDAARLGFMLALDEVSSVMGGAVETVELGLGLSGGGPDRHLRVRALAQLSEAGARLWSPTPRARSSPSPSKRLGAADGSRVTVRLEPALGLELGTPWRTCRSSCRLHAVTRQPLASWVLGAGELPWTQLGFGPVREASGRDDDLIHVSLRGASLRSLLAELGLGYPDMPELRAALPELTTPSLALAALRRRPSFVSVELILSEIDDPELHAGFVLGDPGPLLHTPMLAPSEAQRCLLALARRYQDAARQLYDAPSDREADIIARTLADDQDQLRCASEDPQTHAVATQLRASFIALTDRSAQQ